MKKVLFLTNIPSPYRVDFFNGLGEHCDLTVLFERQAASNRDDSWKNFTFRTFNGVFLKGINTEGATAFCPDVIKYIDSTFDVVICSNFLSPTGMFAIEYMRIKKMPYWLESDGGFATKGNTAKKIVKKHFIHGAMRYFSTGSDHDSYYLEYGARTESIVRYPFSSVHSSDVLENVITEKEKRQLKTKLGFSEEYVVLSVGQFIPRKGFDLLILAANELSRSIRFVLVGGQPTDEYKALEKGDTHISYVSFADHEMLKQYYRAADVFVLPTREDIWGLVINEAMSQGLPVITTTKCAAGNEMIENGVNGFLIPPESVSEIKDKIVTILSNQEIRKSMSEKTLETARCYTIENMVQKHVNEIYEASVCQNLEEDK